MCADLTGSSMRVSSAASGSAIVPNHLRAPSEGIPPHWVLALGKILRLRLDHELAAVSVRELRTCSTSCRSFCAVISSSRNMKRMRDLYESRDAIGPPSLAAACQLAGKFSGVTCRSACRTQDAMLAPWATEASCTYWSRSGACRIPTARTVPGGAMSTVHSPVWARSHCITYGRMAERFRWKTTANSSSMASVAASS